MGGPSKKRKQYEERYGDINVPGVIQEEGGGYWCNSTGSYKYESNRK